MFKYEIKNAIKTERLLLTPLNKNDVQRFVEIAQNMRTEKAKNPDYFLYWRFNFEEAKSDADLSQAAMKLLACADNAAANEVTRRLNICLKNGHIIGYIGFCHNAQDEISSDLGIFLDPLYEHKGYAFEAQKSLLAYYFLNCDDKIYCTIYPKNVPSYQLNLKCGAQKIAHTETSKYGQERDILVITRSAFLKSVFNKENLKAPEEKQVLIEYLQIYNEFTGR